VCLDLGDPVALNSLDELLLTVGDSVLDPIAFRDDDLFGAKLTLGFTGENILDGHAIQGCYINQTKVTQNKYQKEE
jgi:hypothetical protein